MPDGARFCPECGTPVVVGAPSSDSRRIVTALFVDLVGSTVLAETLDPEALRRTMDRYYRACTTAVTEHGGVVEKFIGDAVMAVFGAFVTHEDDALHAVRAACAVREAVTAMGTGAQGSGAGVSLDTHCGIASGEAVVAGALGGAARVVGDVVHTAARLQSHAEPHEILIGEETARLVGGRVRMEAVAPLRVRGKREPVAARRVLSVLDAASREDLVPLVGRDVELRLLLDEFADIRAERRSLLATVAGPPGIGKSRLVREFLGRAGEDAVVLRAGCQAYGAGLAHRPLAEAVWSLPGGWEEARGALETLRPSADRAVTALAVALGIRTESGLPVSVDEIGWAFRRLLEALGRHAPVILVLEDFQWAQPTLSDMVADFGKGARDTPLLVVRVARAETDAVPAGDLALSLDALPPAQTERLVGLLADRAEVAAQDAVATEDDLARVVRECDGNPLFAELLLENLAGPRAVDQGVPTSIRVLLTAWLDRLPATDRAVLERAAGVGGSFTVEDVRALAADEPALAGGVLDDALARLLRSRVIHLSGPPGTYRFTRALARDTLYEMTSKARRAAWHTVLADRLESRPPGPAAESDLAHRLESACRLLSEADPGDPGLPALTGRAARALVATGYRALHRRDLPAAVSLMERGRGLTPDGDPQHRVLAARITDVYAALGRWDSARQAVAEAERRNGDDVPTRETCAILRQLIALRSGGAEPADAPYAPGAAHAVPGPADDLSWCRLHQLSSLRSFAEGRVGAAEGSMRDALSRARGLGDTYEGNRILASICELTQWSPTPLTQAIDLCEELVRRFDGDRSLLVPVLLTRARHLALSDRVDAAREDIALVRRHCDDLALTLGTLAAGQTAGFVESLAGAHLPAAGHYTAAADGLAALGQTRTAATLRLYAARERFCAGNGSGPEAAELAGPPADRPEETRTRAVRLALRARVRARAGAYEDAVGDAERATAALDGTDDPCLIGDVWFEAARVLDAAGEPERARHAAGRALDALTAKEAVLPARTVRAWRAAGPGENR
ncbi:adenylate/guanylate cyclase domain-containing protein [Streptomyces sp. NBC_00102]|uniref:adenylate/guanylate cyclase domain-containing protein n=1 Tax=Streptomyces sp. NBC_00102 TaxID=2975652 RepID=UPI0022577BED|nr:adenylate/guanylate cyclase domain-containing protein [Streptomyces sp. NBC_00102]MCX5396839.1 AAA family ATPase [Streptomyces sp. NBC_00102]